MATKLEFFWDVASPYSYLAATQMEDLQERTGAEVVYRPFLLGGAFKATGNQMPAALPAKARYMREDLRRWAEYYEVRLRLPPDEVVFPINSLLPMRAAVAADLVGAGIDFCHAVFSVYWDQGRDVSQPEVLKDALILAGCNPDEIIGHTQSDTVKTTLRQTTDEAVSRGAFGAPTFFIGEEMFWGNDRLPLIEAMLLASA